MESNKKLMKFWPWLWQKKKFRIDCYLFITSVIAGSFIYVLHLMQAQISNVILGVLVIVIMLLAFGVFVVTFLSLITSLFVEFRHYNRTEVFFYLMASISKYFY